MTRSVLGACAAVVFAQALACDVGGEATVGNVNDGCRASGGAACDASADATPTADAGAGDASAGDASAGDAEGGPTERAGIVLVTPVVQPLGETSVKLTWTAPGGPVDEYEVRASTAPGSTPAVVPELAHLASSATSATLANLTPGTLGHVVVAARVAATPSSDAPSSVLWTPYGAINEDSVSSVTPLVGYPGAPYAEGMFVSANFSMFFSNGFAKEGSFVFAGRPSSSLAKPVYNFASPLIHFANGFGYPDVTDVPHIWSDGVARVLLANDNQNRVLVYNHLPLSPDTATPDLILGQTSWTGTDVNAGASAVNARGFNQASGACFNGTTLYVRDNGNSRILAWNGWPTQMGQPADFVLGQPDMVSSKANSGGLSKASLSFLLDQGAGIDCRGGRLAVTDPGNHRVLIWKQAPTATGVPADVVLGQTRGDVQGQGGAGGLVAGGMIAPQSVATLDGGAGRTAIVVTDATANRVVEWDDLPTTDGAPFDRVYGQPDRTTTTANTGGLSLASLSAPIGLTVDDENRFWVADFSNGRALRFDLGSATAIAVFGQRTGTSTELFPGSFSATRSAWSHFARGAFSLDPTSGLFTTSSARAMIWNAPPLDGNTPVSAVQGQPDATTSATHPVSGTSLTGFGAAVRLGGRVYWSDTGRILSKMGTFSSNDSVPDVVLGNQDFTGKTVAPTTLDYAIQPTFLATDGTRLLAVDGARIVVWNTAPVVSNGPIDLAIGQPSLTVNGTNTGGVSARALGGGRNAMTLSGGKLIVADPANNRVLVWNAVPAVTGASADVVIGQADFASSAPGADLDRMNAPSSVAVLDGNLIVSDTGNARLLVFAGVPTTSGVAAARSWDPRTATFSLPTWFNAQELTPHDLGAYDGRLYVGQTGRVLVLPDMFAR